jgi:hypothetical protein
MSVTATFVNSCKVGNENYLTGSEDVIADTAQVISDSVSGLNVLTSVLNFTAAKMTGIYILPDFNGTLTFYGTANVVVPLRADVPYSWVGGSNQANPLAACVTVASGGATGTGLLQARIMTVA